MLFFLAARIVWGIYNHSIYICPINFLTDSEFFICGHFLSFYSNEKDNSSGKLGINRPEVNKNQPNLKFLSFTGMVVAGVHRSLLRIKGIGAKGRSKMGNNFSQLPPHDSYIQIPVASDSRMFNAMDCPKSRSEADKIGSDLIFSAK